MNRGLLTDTNERMNGAKIVSDIKRVAPIVGPELVSVALTGLDIGGFDIVERFEPLEHLGKRGREAGVGLVAVRPKGIATCRRQGVHFEQRVIGWNRLVARVRMPGLGVKAAHLLPLDTTLVVDAVIRSAACVRGR